MGTTAERVETLVKAPVRRGADVTRRAGVDPSIREFVVPLPLTTRWQQRAMCRGKTGLFFAARGERQGRRNQREALARAYCAACVVVSECREAGRRGREHGLWGDENDEQRAGAGYPPVSLHRRSVAAVTIRARSEAGTSEATDVA